ncbi:glycosyl transferase [Cellulosimicrobium cellulans]|uniref:Glycosyl transferase n=1 Tax=Cellulosimicrobium cellulans TaxID=1710 RepID=A0A1Y0HRB8_CELCE|nr:glycosyltransferase family 2 protein [Cellulosimicrobium cellulans]ARU50510.1 glycosyl transferase [Cellulosimicrobium cellulans]
MSPRVSVVVPAYNNGDYIAATMRSVLDQTFDDFELVVADHSSTDDTWEQLQAFADDPRVRLVRTEAGGGARRNWNRVSELARGELIKLVCGDDLVHPTMLARQVAAIDAAGPGAVLVASQRDLVDARGDVFVRARGLGDLDGVVDGAEALRATVRSGTNLFGEPACVLMRTDALRRAGWWQDLRYYIDAGSYAHVMVQGQVVALRESLASFRVSASQWSVRLMQQQAEEAAEFHRLARELAPATITEQDVRRGDRLAKVVALQRRAAYLVLGRRMRPRGQD